MKPNQLPPIVQSLRGSGDGLQPSQTRLTYNKPVPLRAHIFLIALITITTATAAEWRQFRGPNSSGVSDTSDLPARISPTDNVLWKTDLPAGHSSPILTADRIFLTAVDSDRLMVFCLDRSTGKILWRREVPRPRRQKLHAMNDPASPSPVSDGKNVYAFFTDFGLISFGLDGNERWKTPLGPFNNPFGMGASPVLAGDVLIQNCDSETGSFMIAVDIKTGTQRWRIERPEFTRGFSTPLLWKSPEGIEQVLIPGTAQLTAYAVNTGAKLWWVTGLTWQLKPTPVMAENIIYVLGWAGGADTGQQEDLPEYAWLISKFDENRDGKVSLQEITEKRYKEEIDLDNDGFVSEREWTVYRAKRRSQNSLMAIKLGGSRHDGKTGCGRIRNHCRTPLHRCSIAASSI